MADLERDLIDGDIRSPIDGSVVGAFASTSDSSPGPSIDSGDLSQRRHEETLAQSAATDLPACSGEENLREQISLLAIESSGGVENDQAHQSAPSSRDKGKAPVRADDESTDRIHSEDVDPRDGNLHPLTSTTNTSDTPENREMLKLSAGSDRNATDATGLDESSFEIDFQSEVRPASPETGSKHSGVRFDDEHRGTTSSRPAEPEPKTGPPPVIPTPNTIGLSSSGGTGAQTFRPLQYGEPGWEKSADRPPKKLPIRFKDAVGRKYVFPWEKANTWAGMERLIRSCFAHVDVIGPHVNEGHYDLLSFLPFSTLDVGFGMPFQAEPQHSSTTAPPAGGTVEPPVGGVSNEPPILQAPTPPPAAPSTPVQQQSLVVILPELWEDLIEPGMFVSMHMWPMDHPPPPPPPPNLHPAGPPLAPGFAGGRGRGRGRGGGRGMGPMLPHRPPGWIVVEPQKPRGKTRKRREGPSRIR
ncbi:hypothetical protein F5Y13DRAFT_4230 [Hypoxylon sp. FL1857]|nr:hypothetical protein F5Y13DRAFT_4230 [Hypoxylon sp. FL1857]